jgi:hypothetical protein
MKTNGQTPTVVETYVQAAIRNSRFEAFADGAVLGMVAACPGVIATGADVHACSIDLYARLQLWVRHFLEEGIELPVLDGIDLNAERAQLLQTYAPEPAGPPDGELYVDEAALEAAFGEHDRLRPATGRRRSRAIRSSAT